MIRYRCGPDEVMVREMRKRDVLREGRVRFIDRSYIFIT